MSRSLPQTDQFVNEAALSELGNTARDFVSNLLSATNDRLKIPAALSMSGNVLTVGNTKVTTGPDSRSLGLSPVGGVSIDGLTGTLDFDTGTGTGDVETVTLPTMNANYYILAGIEIRSDQKVYVIFGSQAAASGDVGLPAFLSSAKPVGTILMQAGATGGQGDWVTPSDDSVITQFGAGSGGGGGGTISQSIEQVAHGFALGNALYWTGSAWAKAQANDADTLAQGVVTRVIDVDNFELSFGGKIEGLSTLTPGSFYYLDDETAGAYTLSPNFEGLSQTLFFAVSATEGFILIDKSTQAEFNSYNHSNNAGEFVSLDSSSLTLRKGLIELSDKTWLSIGGGSLERGLSDQIVNLSTLVSPAPDTTYYLYIDREQLGAEETLTGVSRPVVKADDISHFTLLTSRPSEVSPFRYVFLGVVRTDGTGDWQRHGIGDFAGPWRKHDLNGGVYSADEIFTTTVNTANTHTLPHSLTGTPQFVQVFYYDGTNKGALDPTHIINVDGTNVVISTAGLTFGSGEYVEVQARYIPSSVNKVIANSTQFVSIWYENTSTTTLAHGLSDAGAIKDISVIEWDLSAGEYRTVSATSIVTNWDDTNLYLDWTGYTPSSTLKYQIVAGGNVLPVSMPTEFGGYTKFVGFGPGSYATLTAAIAASAAGDSILVKKGYSISAEEVVNVGDIKIEFAPGVEITVTGGTNALRVTSNEVHLIRPKYKVGFSGTLTSAIKFDGCLDCTIDKGKVESTDAGVTITNAYELSATAERNYINGVSVATAGAITNSIVDSGTENQFTVRG